MAAAGPRQERRECSGMLGLPTWLQACLVPAFVPHERSQARCPACFLRHRCPAGTTTYKGTSYSTTSAAEAGSAAECGGLFIGTDTRKHLSPGWYYTGTRVQPCLAGFYCTGGTEYAPASTTIDGATDCPVANGLTSPAAAASVADCEAVLAPGYAWDGANVVSCPQNKYCVGGGNTFTSGVTSGSQDCPAGSTSSAGASACVVPAGYYWSWADSTVTACTPGFFCNGGLAKTGPGRARRQACPVGSTSAVGAAVVTDCGTLTASYYWTGSTMALCQKGEYCPGGDYTLVSGSAAGAIPCPSGFTTWLTGSTSEYDCVSTIP